MSCIAPIECSQWQIYWSTKAGLQFVIMDEQRVGKMETSEDYPHGNSNADDRWLYAFYGVKYQKSSTQSLQEVSFSPPTSPA